MAVVRWEPFRELTALQNEMNRWFGTPSPGNGVRASTWAPASDVWETEDEFVLSFDLPGIPEDEISVEFDDDVLTVSGERSRIEESSDEHFHRFERRYGAFQRSVSLPAGVDESKINARYDKGVLEIRVPKPEEQKPRRIEIQANGSIDGAAERR